MDEIKRIINENITKAFCGIYFTRNVAGDEMTTLYDDGKHIVDICYHWGYFEIFGLNKKEREEISTYYFNLLEGNKDVTNSSEDCTWFKLDGIYKTSCGHLGRKYEEFICCPYCGRKIRG